MKQSKKKNRNQIPKKTTLPEEKNKSGNMKHLFILGGVILLAFGVSFALKSYNETPSSTEQYTQKASTKGEKIFNRYCASCHGIGAVGEDPENHRNGGKKPDGSYYAPALNGTAHAFHHADNLLFQTIKNGSAAPDSPMRGFKGVLSDEEIYEVMNYFKSLWPEEIQEKHAQMSKK